MQVLLTESEYNDLKESANKAENYEKLYDDLMLQHLALKDEHAKLLVFGVSSNNEKLKASGNGTYFNKAYAKQANQKGHEEC